MKEETPKIVFDSRCAKFEEMESFLRSVLKDVVITKIKEIQPFIVFTTNYKKCDTLFLLEQLTLIPDDIDESVSFLFIRARLVNSLSFNAHRVCSLLAIHLFCVMNDEIKESTKVEINTYLIKDTYTGITKIGKTTDLFNRLNILMCGNINLKVIAVLNKDVEKELQNRYKEYRVRREWYNLSDGQIKEIIKDYGFCDYRELNYDLDKHTPKPVFKDISPSEPTPQH